MITSRKRPSKEDFNRAKAVMRKNDQGLSEVRGRILDRFKDRGLHEMMVLYSPGTNSFGAYVFFSLEDQLVEAEVSGLAKEIERSVMSELERVGRGDQDSLTVNFEFDSHETVVREHDGNYYSRLY